MKIRRVLALTLSMVMLIALLAACAGDTAPPPAVVDTPAADNGAAAADPPVAPADRERIVVFVEGLVDDYVAALQEFYWTPEVLEELNVELQFRASGVFGTYSTQMMEFATGHSEADIILFMPAWMGDFAPHLEPLEPLAVRNNVELHLDDILPSVRDVYCSWDGVLLAFPFDVDQHQLYFNLDAFEREENKADFYAQFGYELRPPRTWDEYADMAEFFHGRDWSGSGTPLYGVAEGWGAGGNAYWWFMGRFAAYGGLYFDADMNPLINTPNGLAAMENLQRVSQFAPPGAANFSYMEVSAAFNQGQVAMAINWSSLGMSSMDPERSEIVGRVGVTMLPGAYVNGELIQRPTLPTGWTLGISRYSSPEVQDAAIKLLGAAACPDRNRDGAMFNGAIDGFRISTFDPPDVWATVWPDYPEYGLAYVNVKWTTLETGLPDLQIPGADEYVQAFDREISNVILGLTTPQQALENAEAEWIAITERRGFETQKAAWLAQYEAIRANGITFIPFN